MQPMAPDDGPGPTGHEATRLAQPEAELFTMMRTQRSVRAYKTDPVSDEDIARIIEAATWAPNAGNAQLWRFVVVRDPGTKLALAEIYRESHELFRDAMAVERQSRLVGAPPEDEAPPELRRGVRKSADLMANSLEHIPVLIVVGYDRAGAHQPTDGPFKAYAQATVLTGAMPAVQNLLLAARALGLGTCLTTISNIWEGKVKVLLKIPKSVQVITLIPLGYPDGSFAGFPPGRRKPIDSLVHFDRWGGPPPTEG